MPEPRRPQRDRPGLPDATRSKRPPGARAKPSVDRPDDEVRSLLETARVEFAAGNLEAARRAAINAKQAAPRLAAAREQLGLASFALGAWHEAAQELLAFRRFSGDRRADALIAECRTNEGRPDKALEFLTDLRREQVGESVWADAEIARARAHAARDNVLLARRLLVAASKSIRSAEAKERVATALRALA